MPERLIVALVELLSELTGLVKDLRAVAQKEQERR